MKTSHKLAGVYVAAVTPMKDDFSVDLEAVPELLSFYAERGCHGALLLGTTGEGPSFAADERIDIMRAATKVRDVHPEFQLMAGTGTPSLEETALLNKAAFDSGFQTVVALPPYYFRQVSDEGLLAWFQAVIERSVPGDGSMMGYHIPGVSGVSLSFELLVRLKDKYPNQFAGIKDSSGDLDYCQRVGDHFKGELVVLTGNDRLLSFAMENKAAGCITAMANIHSPTLRVVWDAYQRGEDASEVQNQLGAWRSVLEGFSPYGPTLKGLLAHCHGFSNWSVRPPLESLHPDQVKAATTQFKDATQS